MARHDYETPWRRGEEDPGCVYDSGNFELAHNVGEKAARLIAAAPDLLAALEDVANSAHAEAASMLDDYNDMRASRVLLDIRDQARAAIAKATGKET